MRSTAISLVLFALLAINAAIYAVEGRASEGLDALAWFALLALFGIETRCPAWAQRPRHALLLDLLRLIAAAAVVWAAISFIREREWLDAANAWLWIGVVAVLELELRGAVWVARHRRLVSTGAFTLYGALALVASTWLLQGAWFDAYDALLWIAAFALLEMDLQRYLGEPRPTPGAQP